eukprot:25101-Pelagococcus_subviridis.AAC.5
MGPVIHTANAQEERRGNKAMAQHQNQGSFDPLKVEREQAKCDESHMGHRRVGNDLLQVNLPQGGKGSIDDPDKAQRVHQRHEVQRSHWEERDGESKESIGPQLQQDTCKDHRPSRRRFHVGFSHQHQHGTNKGVQKELIRRTDLPLSRPPYANDHEHGQKHRFEEDVEEKKIQKTEDRDHTHFQKKECNAVLLDLGMDVHPPYKQADRDKEGGQHKEEQGDPINPKRDRHIAQWQPAQGGHELKLRGGGVEDHP